AFDTNQTLNFLSVLKTSPTNNGAEITPAEPEKAAKKTSLNQKLGSMLRQTLEQRSNTASALPKATVDLISITNGLVQFKDNSLQPPFLGSVQELNGTVSGISSEELKRSDVHFTGRALRAGPITIAGKINPLSHTEPTELSVSSSGVDISPTSPYAGKFLGY